MKILIAEDDPVSRRLIEACLTRWGYEVVSIASGGEAWKILQRDDAPRLAILDWMMPEMDGPSVCRAVRARAAEPYTYILMLTSKTGQSDVIAGLAAGADDYVTKPFDAHELEVRLRAGRRILDLQSDLIKARDALQEQATHDSMTGLWNRGAIMDHLRKELSRSDRAGVPMGVLMADIDRFKSINDTKGHLIGDFVLREVAWRMNSAIRPYDAIGRYGGEEFLVIVPGSNAEGTLKVAERLRAAVGSTEIVTPDGALKVTISVGAAVSDPGGEGSPEALLHAADEALYRAKNAGRDRSALAARTPELQHR